MCENYHSNIQKIRTDGRQIERQTDRRTDRQTDGRTDKQTDGKWRLRFVMKRHKSGHSCNGLDYYTSLAYAREVKIVTKLYEHIDKIIFFTMYFIHIF